MISSVVVALALAAAPPGSWLPAPWSAAQAGDGVALFVTQLEAALQAGSQQAVAQLVAADADATATTLASLAAGSPTRAVVRERDRNLLASGDVELLLDTLTERGSHGQVATWRATIRPYTSSAAGDAIWRLTSAAELSAVDGLHRLSLSEAAYDVRGLVLSATDLSLHMRSGVAFAAHVGGGITALVLHGRGEMTFAPGDPAERTQLAIFAKKPALRASFREAYIRLHPGDLTARISSGALTPRVPNASDRRRAEEIFNRFVGRTYSLDLQDLSRERWSLSPVAGDLVAEVRTDKFGDLTYALARGEAEDISLFQRARRRNIAAYSSPAKIAARGRFYSEDELADYDVEHYDVEARLIPARDWIEGVARLRLNMRARQATTITLRLAESLTVRGVVAPRHGRLMHLRVTGQNNLIVTLPAVAKRDERIELEVQYGGRLPPQGLDGEAVAPSGQEFEPMLIPLEPRWIYSNRSYWYPQSTVTDYATARLRIVVPREFEVIATGRPAGDREVIDTADAALHAFTFASDLPARYLSCVVSRFSLVETRPLPGEASLRVVASPRQIAKARDAGEQADAIIRFYRGLLGDVPYPQLTIAVSEAALPGGHSPAYFVVLNQTLPSAAVTWRADPVSFEQYPSFFIAHEIAHQWWGQAVGWKNYHEQWLSEGFAQYFAALYAGEQRGPDAFATLMKQMRRWGLDQSEAGPIYLGYRLGHIQQDSRVFRALVYNKAAVVLHMLRRMVGDDAFFEGVRRFFETSRFAKASTDDFRLVMEEVTGRDLTRFFEGWIYGDGIPDVRVSHRIETAAGGMPEVVIHAEQLGPLFDLPILIRVDQAGAHSREALLRLTGVTGTLRIPLDPGGGQVRRIVVDADASALARFAR